MKNKLYSVLALSLIISACTAPRYQHKHDFTPAALDLKSIADPTPVSEPKSAMGNSAVYKVRGKKYHVIQEAEGFTESGIASWYGMKFHGHRTSNGELYDVYQMTAAHKTLPLPSYVKVTRKDTQQSVVVRVNDRGPFHDGRIIDLSYAAAVKLGIDQAGTAEVDIKVLAAPLDISQRWVQAGALSSNEKAQGLKNRLDKALNSEWPIQVRDVSNSERALYRVHIGPVVEQNIETLLSKLEDAGVDNGLVLMRHQLSM